MAFGRSNSLSINTGATNSLFSQQQQNNPSTQPQPAGGLFGSSTQQSSQAGSLFGGPAAQQQQQQQQAGGGSSLFGGNVSQPQQSGGLFGSTTSQPQQTSSLFGNTQSNAPTTQQSGGAQFGSSLSQPTQQQQPAQQQNAGLFGSTQNRPATSLFGASTAQAQGQPSGSSLFGGSTLFGGSNTQQQSNQPSLFNTQNQQQQQAAPSNSVFGLSASSRDALPSMLGASQYRSNQYQPFAGKLTMGQSTAAAGPQQPVQGAVKINFDEMRPTTRFADCVDEVKNQLEHIDKMIQNQERFCRDIEAFLPKHGENVVSLGPDVELIKDKADAAGNSLALDASGVDGQRKVLDNDSKDFQRCERVVTNLAQPLQYRYAGYSGTQTSTGADGDIAKDMDLVGNYFAPMATELRKTLDSYASNLAEIEGHMRVIEHSAVAQAQQLASRRQGMAGSGQADGEETVRELADTLRGFEASILGAASLVGQCREGVNDLVLGKLGNAVGGR